MGDIPVLLRELLKALNKEDSIYMKKEFQLSICIIFILQLSFAQDSIKFVLVKNIRKKVTGLYDESSYPRNFTVLNDKIVFVAAGDSVGIELFITDGTSDGTRLLKNINSYHQDLTSERDNSSHPYELTVFGDMIILAL